MTNLPQLSKKILLLFMKQMYYSNIKISPDLEHGVMRLCEGEKHLVDTMHHPNGPALSINYAFDSASKSGLRGKEKRTLTTGKKVGILSFVPWISCYR